MIVSVADNRGPSGRTRRGAVGRWRVLLPAAVMCLIGVAAYPPAAASARHRATCPGSAQAPSSQQRRGSRQALVPGHPHVVRLCRYRGRFKPHSAYIETRLVASRLITHRATVDRLVRRIDRLPGFPHTSARTCPGGRPSRAVAYFRYGKGPDEEVLVQLGNCYRVTNGARARDGLSVRGFRLVHQLIRLTTRGGGHEDCAHMRQH